MKALTITKPVIPIDLRLEMVVFDLEIRHRLTAIKNWNKFWPPRLKLSEILACMERIDYFATGILRS